MFLVYGRISPGSWPAALAGRAPSATVAAAEARQVKAPRGDGHTLRAEDAANSSGGGGSHNCVLSLSVLSIRPCTISDSLQFTSCLSVQEGCNGVYLVLSHLQAEHTHLPQLLFTEDVLLPFDDLRGSPLELLLQLCFLLMLRSPGLYAVFQTESHTGQHCLAQNLSSVKVPSSLPHMGTTPSCVPILCCWPHVGSV